MGGRGTHVACKVTLTGLGHFGHHSRACKSTEKGSVGPEIYSDPDVPGLHSSARARRTKSFPGAGVRRAVRALLARNRISLGGRWGGGEEHAATRDARAESSGSPNK